MNPRKSLLYGTSAPRILQIPSWNFYFSSQIPLRGKSFGKVLEWYVAVKEFGLPCWKGCFLNFANSKVQNMFA